VANAVLDGADGILLGQETLRGTYPVEVIDMLSSICKMVRPEEMRSSRDEIRCMYTAYTFGR
jgi:pyruvate kinase